MKKVDVEDEDGALHAWMRETHAPDIPIFQAKAHELAAKLGHPNFKCSNGWW